MQVHLDSRGRFVIPKSIRKGWKNPEELTILVSGNVAFLAPKLTKKSITNARILMAEIATEVKKQE